MSTIRKHSYAALSAISFAAAPPLLLVLLGAYICGVDTTFGNLYGLAAFCWPAELIIAMIGYVLGACNRRVAFAAGVVLALSLAVFGVAAAFPPHTGTTCLSGIDF